MTRFGYVWLLFSVVLALGVVEYETHGRDVAIRDATRGALYTGVNAGCQRDNQIRVRVRLPINDCTALAHQLTEDYLHNLP